MREHARIASCQHCDVYYIHQLFHENGKVQPVRLLVIFGILEVALSSLISFLSSYNIILIFLSS